MSVRPYHHGNLRETLLRSALTAVRERGVDALSLRELARDLGVSHAAPRRHFSDRQALLDAVALEGFSRLESALHRASDSAGQDFDSRLRAGTRAYIDFATQERDLLELMFTGKHREGAENLQAAAEQTFSAMLEVIHQGQAEGALPAGDPERIGLVLFATTQGIATLYVTGMVSDEQLGWLIDEAIDRFLRGARPSA